MQPGHRESDSPPRRIDISALALICCVATGVSTCHGRVGEVICGFLWCPARSTCHRRRRGRNPFVCTRSGDLLLPRPMNQKTTCRIEAEDRKIVIHPGRRWLPAMPKKM
jgi:hypothetical protein